MVKNNEKGMTNDEKVMKKWWKMVKNGASPPVHQDLFRVTNTCEQKWQIWPSTSTRTMVFCWSCKQSWSWSNANPPVAGQGLTRSQNSCRIEFSSKNGREISSSVFGTTRWPQLYLPLDCVENIKISHLNIHKVFLFLYLSF